MFNPMRPELSVALHRERVAEGLRRETHARSRPADRRRRPRRRLLARLRMA
jgi:hypothetical protein